MNRGKARSHILVMRAGQLGDTVFATSIIEPLRRRYGDATRIDLVVKQGLADLFRHDDRIGRVFELAHRNLPIPLNLDKCRIVSTSWRHPYDLLVNLETGALLNDLARLVRAAHKVGNPYGGVADDREGEHAVGHLRRIYRTFLSDAELQQAVPTLVGPHLATLAGRLGLPREYLVLNPTNSQFTKRDYRSYRAWPLEHWRELIRTLAARRPESILLVGGQGEQEYFRHLSPLPENVHSLAGRTGLDELITLLAHARAVVTTDTGPAHLAAAVNTPVFAIFGPSDDRKTGPFPTPENDVHILNAHLPCSPCSLTGGIEDCDWNECMHEVTPAQLFAALEELLDRSAG